MMAAANFDISSAAFGVLIGVLLLDWKEEMIQIAPEPCLVTGLSWLYIQSSKWIQVQSSKFKMSI